jgi:UDP-glucose 4-epimerase
MRDISLEGDFQRHWYRRPVLVTGGAGFVGSHIVDALVENGARVRVFDNFSTGVHNNLNRAAELFEGDVRNPRDVTRALAGIDTVFHEAAQINPVLAVEDPILDCEVNVMGTLRLLIEASRCGVTNFVMASTNLYGDGAVENGIATEDTPILSLPHTLLSPYAAAKAAAEAYLKVFQDEFGLNTVRLRYSNVYGPRQTAKEGGSGVVALFAQWALAGKPIRIYGDGEQTRDFVFVKDVAAANLLAASQPSAAGKAFNVSTEEQTSILQLAEMIREITGTRTPLEFLPPRCADFRRVSVDTSRVRRELEWVPNTSLAEGLVQYVDWLRQRRSVVGSEVHAD